MKKVAFLLLATTLFAAEAKKPPQKAAAKTEEMHRSSIKVGAEEVQERSVLIVEPKARAADFVEAFHLLRKEKPTQKLMVMTKQEQLMNVTDLSVSEKGTLLFVKTLSNQGSRLQVIPIENLVEISYSP